MEETCDYRLKKIELNIEKVLDLINGKEGMVTTLMLQQDKINNLPTPSSLKAYSFCGGGLASIMALISWALYGIFKSGGSS